MYVCCIWAFVCECVCFCVTHKHNKLLFVFTQTVHTNRKIIKIVLRRFAVAHSLSHSTTIKMAYFKYSYSGCVCLYVYVGITIISICKIIYIAALCKRK